jgi:hypothetical protein
MLSIDPKRAAATLAIAAGLLVAAAPAGAQGGGADFTKVVGQAPAPTVFQAPGLVPPGAATLVGYNGHAGLGS